MSTPPHLPPPPPPHYPATPPPPPRRRRSTGLVLAIVGGAAAIVLVACCTASYVVGSQEQERASSNRPAAAESTGAAGKATPAPSKTAKPKPLPPHAKVTDREWLQVAKDPGKHAGRRIIVHGVVTQFDAATGQGMFRASVGGQLRKLEDGFVDYPTNTVLDGDPGRLEKVVENDVFTAKVTVSGEYDYSNVFGGGTVVPQLHIDEITVTGQVTI